MNAPLLELENVSVRYRTRQGPILAVDSVSLRLGEGDSLGLVGESGCGKSTIALAIVQFLGNTGEITGGRLRFRGRDLANLAPAELRGYRLGDVAMVYQEPMSALNPSMTVGRQLVEVAVARDRLSPADAEKAARTALTEVQLADVDRLMRAYPHQLSGGQQQRVVIAMALLSRPALLVLDEPTTALDATIEAGIVDLVGQLRRSRHMAVLFVSHNLGLIRQTCDRVAVMYAGQIVETGTTAHVLAQPRHPYTAGLLDCLPRAGVDKHRQPLRPIVGQLPSPRALPPGCRFAPRCRFAETNRCDKTVPELVDLPDSRTVRCRRWEAIDLAPEPPVAAESPTAAESTPAIRAMDVGKEFRLPARTLRQFLARGRRATVKANVAVDLEVHRGETVAIVGESGSGKSTLARLIAGLETSSSGEIEVLGVPVARQPVAARQPELRARLQMVFQDPNDTLNPSHSVVGQIGRAVRRLSDRPLSRPDVAARVHSLLDLVRLSPDVAARTPAQLSGGQRQRVSIARALAGRAEAIIADEPVSALDTSVQAAVVDLLLSIQRGQRTALIYISHDLGLVRYLADRVYVMYRGRIVETATTEALFAPPFHPYTEALLSALPNLGATERRRVVLPPPESATESSGCVFAPRCPRRIGPVCDSTPPPLQELADNHRLACHIPASELAARPS
jgi:peptide/nickel transport system ATP-binding protein